MKLLLSTFASLSLAVSALSGTLSAQSPVPNQECNTTCQFYTSGTTGSDTVTVWFDQATDLTFAQMGAISKLRRNLGQASGVICYICTPSNIQCGRHATEIGIPIESDVYIPNNDESLEGWTVTVTFVGYYTVECEPCE